MNLTIMDNNYKILIEFIVSLISKANDSPKSIEGGSCIQITFDDRETIISDIYKFNKSRNSLISYEKRGSQAIAFSIDYYSIFFNKDSFIRLFEINELKKDFCVLEEKGCFIFDYQNDIVYHNSIKIDDNNFIINHIYNHKILNLLKDDTSADNFCTFNDKLKQYIISIIPEKGKFEIGYKNFKELGTADLNLKKEFKNISEFKKDFIPFFKNEVYDKLKSYNSDERYSKLITYLYLIINNAKNNYDLYVSGFSVQTFIDDFREHQYKYFSVYRDILNKIYTYSISIPVSLTATILGILNVKQDNYFALWTISFSYILFSVLSIFYQCYLMRDLDLLRKEFNIDKEKIKSSVISGNLTMKEILSIIEKRIGSLRNAMIAIVTILVAFVIIVFLLSYYLSKPFC